MVLLLRHGRRHHLLPLFGLFGLSEGRLWCYVMDATTTSSHCVACSVSGRDTGHRCVCMGRSSDSGRIVLSTNFYVHLALFTEKEII